MKNLLFIAAMLMVLAGCQKSESSKRLPNPFNNLESLNVDVTPFSITLGWPVVENASLYELNIYGSDGEALRVKPAEGDQIITSEPYAAFTGLEADTVYIVEMIVHPLLGSSLYPSESVGLPIRTEEFKSLDPVELTVAEKTFESVKLTWKSVPFAGSYELSLDNFATSVSTESCEYTFVNLAPKDDYTISAKAIPASPSFAPSEASLVNATTEDGFDYANDHYTVVLMKDGNYWMAENLRYLPAGLTPASDLTNLRAGVYNALAFNAAKTGLEFSSEAVAKNGYLYQADVTFGFDPGTNLTEAQAKELEGAQGICPEGWHIPTAKEIVGLVGKAVAPYTTDTTAPYYSVEKSNGLIELLNEDGFNADAVGYVSITKYDATSGSLIGYNATYDGYFSGFWAGSTCTGLTNNTPQFLGFLAMPKNGTFNGSKVTGTIAVPVRCVRAKTVVE